MTPPTAAQAISIYRRLTTTRVRRGRLRWLALGLVALPAASTALLALAGGWGRDLFDNVMEVHFRLLVPLVPALAASPLVSEEVDNRTFTFLFARPAPRWTLLVGKFVAVIAPLVVLFLVSVTVSYAIAMVRPPATGHDLVDNLPMLARSLLAVALGVLVFGAIAAVLGAWLPGHPFIAVLGYLLVVEGLVASLKLVISVAGMSWHLRNVAGLPMAQPGGGMLGFAEPQLDAWISVVVLLLVSGLALFGAAASVNAAEYHGTDR